MAGINFLSDNYVNESSITITTGAANAQFPVDNIKNESTAIKFRSAGNTVVLEFDLGTNRTIDTIAIVGDATSQLGVTVMSVKTSVTTDFSLSTPIPIALSAEFNMGWEFTTSVSHRFVEITFTGTGSFAEVSNIFIGEKINLEQNSFSTGSFKYTYKDKSKVNTNRNGQKFIDELHLTKKLAGAIEFCTKTEQETLDDMFIRHGIHEPLWVIVDTDNDAMNDGEYRLTMYGYMDKVPEWSANGGQIYSTSMSMDQVV